MTRRALYIIGEPGIGKSRALKLALPQSTQVDQRWQPFAHARYPGGVVLGDLTHDVFPGTDRLSMGAITLVEAWIHRERPPHVVAEGDRLSNDRFFTFLQQQGYQLTVVALIVTDPRIAEERRQERAAQVGRAQASSFVKGRQTKTANLIRRWRAVAIDASQEPEAVAAALRAFLPPLEDED